MENSKGVDRTTAKITVGIRRAIGGGGRARKRTRRRGTVAGDAADHKQSVCDVGRPLLSIYLGSYVM